MILQVLKSNIRDDSKSSQVGDESSFAIKEVDGTLTDKQKETLEKFEECINEMHGITERDAFSYGFRLGVQPIAESFLLPIGAGVVCLHPEEICTSKIGG